jgi:hypothetical protein
MHTQSYTLPHLLYVYTYTTYTLYHAGTLSAISNPLTTITVGAMADLGYTVSYATADSYDKLIFNARKERSLLKPTSDSIQPARDHSDMLSLRYDPILDPPKPLPKSEDRMEYLISLQAEQAQKELLSKKKEVPKSTKAAPKKKDKKSNRNGH